MLKSKIEGVCIVMLFLKKKWYTWVNALCLVLMLMLGLYLFNDKVGLFDALSGIFNGAQDAVTEQHAPRIEWSWRIGLLFGVFFGSFCGALIHGAFKILWGLEESRGFFGKTFGTALWGLISGFLVMLGGITAGDALAGQFSSAVQHSPGALFFLLTALISAGITALFIERSKSKDSADGKDGE